MRHDNSLPSRFQKSSQCYFYLVRALGSVSKTGRHHHHYPHYALVAHEASKKKKKKKEKKKKRNRKAQLQ